HSSALLPQAPRWQLTPLDDLGGAGQLIRNWFGQDNEVGRDLVDAVSQKPQLVSLVRVPLLGALVCWLRQLNDHLILPAGPTSLLDQGLRQLLLHSIQGAGRSSGDGSRVLAEPADSLADELLDVLSELAHQTFNGERWVLQDRELRSELKKLTQDQDLGSISAL